MKPDRMDPAPRAALSETLRAPRYELVPTASSHRAAEALARETVVTVTASPRKGQETTVDLAVELSHLGFAVVPHLAARLLRDRKHLELMLTRLADSAINEIFVVGGDGDPRGEFSQALDVIRIMAESDQFRIGVAGYPEGHPLIDEATLMETLRHKQDAASYVVSQMCFDPEEVRRWVGRLRGSGIDLPVMVGVPGAVEITRLISMAGRIGVGGSIRFLTRHRGLARRLLSPSFSPTELAVSFAPILADPDLKVIGLHFYTFNQVAATETWREKLIAQLES